MKLKTGLDYSTDNFWADLDAGHLNPADILETPEEVQRVQNALAALAEFRVACEEQIVGFTVVEEHGSFERLL